MEGTSLISTVGDLVSMSSFHVLNAIVGQIDGIVTNPPFGIMGTARQDKDGKYPLEKMGEKTVLRKCVELQPRFISFLAGINTLSIPRVKFLRDNGYHKHSVYRFTVDDWLGVCS